MVGWLCGIVVWLEVSAWEWDGGRRGPHSVTDVVDAVPLHW